MNKYFIQTREFSKELDALLKKRSLLIEDFNDLNKQIAENPKMGDLIMGSGGVRKVRLKSATRGKSGGFRVCYYYLTLKEHIYLLWIYSKNEQANLTAEEKGILKSLVTLLKGKE
ncbi:MAG: type II toxin-antitoxin system RelE/ParE family toxin [Candidatus Babeliaceae bacterium]|nr:type II toxin-antitoxin system RelE/ParE family toxin [Candidatus Babeliaceae bacterium]